MRALLTLLTLLSVACRASAPVPEDHPGEAEEYYAMKRRGAKDPHARYAAARIRMDSMSRFSSATGVVVKGSLRASADSVLEPWTFLGPGNIGGRTRTLIIDPVTPDVMYAGGVSGGVWKTTDAGAHWRPIGDALTNLAVNSMVMDPRDNTILYAGTGEGYFREDVRGTGLPLRGNGIFVTRDAGETWQQLPSTATEDFHWVNDLAISRHDSKRVYAATRSGVWRSGDAGASWTRVLPTDVRGGCLELTERTDASQDYLFASCGTFEQATVYRAKRAEGDQAWEPVLSEPDMGRTSLAIAPSRPSTMYALSAANPAQTLLAVFRSDRDGDEGTWTPVVTGRDPTKLNTLLLTNPLGASQPECGSGKANIVPMGWYCNVIAVDPADPERVWAAGVDLFRSDDGGRYWGVASYWWSGGAPSYAHADVHGIVFHPRDQSLFTLTDGGVFRSDNRLDAVAFGSTAPCSAGNSQVRFTALNHNYGVTQFYNGAVFPDGHRFIGGAQDNGTLIGSIGGGVDGWQNVWGGDGGYVAINPVDPRIVYAESQNGNLVRATDGITFRPLTRRPNDEFLFVTPFVIDPNRPTTLWLGGRRLWRSDDEGNNWTAVSNALEGLVSAVAVAPGQSETVLAGTNEGSMYRTRDGSAWSRVSPRPGFVSSIAFDPANPSTAYMTYAGFGGTHVWKSVDGGATWTGLDGEGDGALPDIPVHSIAIDTTRLYLGTDLGVFVSLDGGRRWAVENTGFAAAVTETVLIARGARGPAVYAFTHGRGVWRTELTPVAAGPRRRAVTH